MSNENIMKKIRIKSFVLKEEIRDEELEELPEEMLKEAEEEERVAIRNAPYLLYTDIVEVNVSSEDFEALSYIFRLYGIPIEPIENGIEIDIRKKEKYTYREKLPEDI